MSEMEVPLEQSQEDLHHHAHHSPEKWVTGVALSSAIIAVLAAVTVLIAGSHADEGMLAAGKENNAWSHYQAKSIKSGQVQTKITILEALGKEVPSADKATLERYAKEQEEIAADAKKEKEESEFHLQVHDRMAYGVTFFQVSIAIAAIAALSKKKQFWFVGLAFGLVGTGLAIWGLTTKPGEKPEPENKAKAELVTPRA